jgi:hypothetical protein
MLEIREKTLTSWGKVSGGKDHTKMKRGREIRKGPLR